MVTAVSVRGLFAYPAVRLQIVNLLIIFILLMLAEPWFSRQSRWGQSLFVVGQVGVMIGLFIFTPLGDFWAIILMPACIYVMRHFDHLYCRLPVG